MIGGDVGTDYDVIVLGGGALGVHCAGALAEGGLRVAPGRRPRVTGIGLVAANSLTSADSDGLLMLLGDGERLTRVYALGPEAGEWLQQATLAIRARVALEVLADTSQPFPSFSEIYAAALTPLRREIGSTLQPIAAMEES